MICIARGLKVDIINPSIIRELAEKFPDEAERARRKYKRFDKWLTGEDFPTYNQLVGLAKIFGVPFGDLFLDRLPDKRIDEGLVCVKIDLSEDWDMGLKLTKDMWDEWAAENKIRFFKFSEFVKEEGGFIDSQLVLKMERLREYCGFPLLINSGYRSAKKNEEVGGASHSYHLRGEAVDVSINGFSPSMLYRLLKGAFLVGFGGIILYPAHVHLDIRGVEYFAVSDYNKQGKTK